mgnify:CR=1 FL=1
MAENYQAWIDGDGRMLSLENLLDRPGGPGADRTALFDHGAVALTWDETGVHLRYAPQAVAAGALRGAVRQVRTITRQVTLERWTGSDWDATTFESGALAADELRRALQDTTGKGQSGSSQ